MFIRLTLVFLILLLLPDFYGLKLKRILNICGEICITDPSKLEGKYSNLENAPNAGFKLIKKAIHCDKLMRSITIHEKSDVSHFLKSELRSVHPQI